MDASEKIRSLQLRIDDALAGYADGQPFSLLDFPDHPNVGDSAIWLGEMLYFQGKGLRPAYASSLRTHSFGADTRVSTIFLHGGGNFGTVWPRHQEFRLEILRRHKGTRVVQLPQSIHFAEETDFAETARAIAEHGNFVLMVRDRPSLEMAQRSFDCAVVLCPDLAFQIGPLSHSSPDLDLLCLLRTDKEASLDRSLPAGETAGLRVAVEDWLRDDVGALRVARLRAVAAGLFGSRADRDVRRLDAIARARVNRGAAQLARGRVVVTDRLHAHILSTLLAIPQVLLDNAYGKISRFVEAWTADLDIVSRATSFETAVGQAATLAAGPARPLPQPALG